MRNNEDYLDSLLNNVTKKLSEFDEDFEQKKQTSDAYMTKKNLPPKTLKALETVKENQFLREFEDELKQDDADSFLAEFEAELEGEALEFERTKEAQSPDDDDAYMDQIEQLVRASQSEPQADMMDLIPDFDMPSEGVGLSSDFDMPSEETGLPSGLDLQEDPDGYMGDSMIDSMDDFGDLLPDDGTGVDLSAEADLPPEGMEALGSLFDDAEDDAEAQTDLFGQTDTDEETILPENEMLDDEGIMNLLNGFSEDEALSDIGKMLEADEQSVSLEDLGAEPENLTHAAELAENDRSKRAKGAKKDKKNGFLAKLLDLLFGEDEDAEDSLQHVEEAKDLDNISDENLEILRAMNGDMMELSDEKPAKKGKKEKKKKEKKQKEPKEKKQKEPKPKKPKKEKKPKEKGPREKPLPRGPVIMIWLLALSVFAFVFISNNLLSKSNALLAAERCFDRGDYVSSYGELVSVKIGESETQLYERAKVLAGVQQELNSFYSMMEVRKFDLALDCLVRALGRSDLHMAEAEEWGVTTQMDALVSETTMQLEDQFNVTAAQARELYAIEDRDEYSLALDEVLKGLGLK